MTLYKEKELCDQFETDFFLCVHQDFPCGSHNAPPTNMRLYAHHSTRPAAEITCYDNAQTTFSLGWTERV